MAVSLAQLLENQAPVHPFALNEPIGSLLNFPWLKIKGVLSSLSTQKIRNAINENKEWFVAEKLDGCNVSASSAGWIATRKKIAGHSNFQQWCILTFTIRGKLSHIEPKLSS